MKSTVSFLLISLFFLNSFAQSAFQERGVYGATNWPKGWADIKPLKTEYPEPNKTIPNVINKDYFLTNANTYSLDGKVYVTAGATLNIEPGTIIRAVEGSGAGLVITKGAKIVAEGSSLNPIVFTSGKPAFSRKSGDWGGIILMGDAPINVIGGEANVGYDVDAIYGKYGGINNESNSGSMKYVRIEFAGMKTLDKNEQNALTLAGVGSKTKLDFIEASFGLDDGFEFLGGNVTLNNLFSYKNRDDDFDFNLGAQVTINNSLIVRSPYITSTVSPRCVEIDNYEKKENLDAAKKSTNVTLFHVTMINEGVETEDISGLKKEGIYIGDMCEVSIKNTIISGFKPAISLNKDIEPKVSNFAKIKIEMILASMCDSFISSEKGSNYDDLIEDYYSNSKFDNFKDKNGLSELFQDPKNNSMPDYRLKVNDIKGK